jgi:hypothetical protein
MRIEPLVKQPHRPGLSEGAANIATSAITSSITTSPCLNSLVSIIIQVEYQAATYVGRPQFSDPRSQMHMQFSVSTMDIDSQIYC